MLKNIPAVLPPELIKILDEMGHGDRICIGDGNFPGTSLAKKGGAALVRADGSGTLELLEAVLKLMPLDGDDGTPMMLMEKMESDRDLDIRIWEDYERAAEANDDRGRSVIGKYEKHQFYAQAAQCACIVQSGETAIYASVILRKGIV